jgi:hypothetical protein|tara:strand:+ start:204 stop:467 length:264 start_codon:yes stop_codon:yes gene_type:complete
MDIVRIEWKDIIQTSGWESKDEVECPTIKSIGWLVEADRDTVKICNTLAREDFSADKGLKEYGITAFPKGCIVKIEYLSYEVVNVID